MSKWQCSTTILTTSLLYSFVNNINTPEGGTHLTGFKNAIDERPSMIMQEAIRFCSDKEAQPVRR